MKDEEVDMVQEPHPVDRHRYRRQIIAALKDGLPYPEIARRFRDPEVPVSTNQLKAYARRYLPLALAHPANRDRTRAADVGAALDDIEEAALLLTDAAHQARDDDGSVRDKASVAAEFRQLALVRGRIGGWLSENVNLTVTDTGAQQRLLKHLVAELGPIPGALAALQRALTAVDAEAAIKDLTAEAQLIEHAAE